MHRFRALALKGLRKIYQKTVGLESTSKPVCEQDPDVVSRIIYDKLTDDDPRMIARFGANELNCLVNYLGVKQEQKRLLPFIKGIYPAWWWESGIIEKMHQNAGFFPPTEEKIEQFCELMLWDIPLVDILGSWLPHERYFQEMLAEAQKVNLELLNPYFSESPWIKALKGKNVLVIHPFVETMRRQYEKRHLLFSDPDILPEFNLKIIKAVQSIAGQETRFNDWFEALDYMKSAMEDTEFDICLIGAGAYGFPLAAHAKRIGKKGFHLGGSLQLLFGIRGKRWENPGYNETYNYAKLMNKHWVRPSKEEKPQNARKVENSTYW